MGAKSQQSFYNKAAIVVISSKVEHFVNSRKTIKITYVPTLNNILPHIVQYGSTKCPFCGSTELVSLFIVFMLLCASLCPFVLMPFPLGLITLVCHFELSLCIHVPLISLRKRKLLSLFIVFLFLCMGLCMSVLLCLFLLVP